MDKRIIVTADDLGISPHINRGIVEAFKDGILTSTALLMNVPYTGEGVLIARENPDLEVGIHLSIVEGYSLRGKYSSITDEKDYFSGKPCLIRDWKNFIKKYLTGKIIFPELEEELELQFQQFLSNFDHIPFVNGTQHMHILPKVWKIIFKLCKKYDVKALRLPALQWPNALWLNTKSLFLVPFQVFGAMARNDLKKSGIKTTDDVLGMQFSGKISDRVFIKLLKHVKPGITEIVMHPGYESPELRQNLPWAYATFDWDIERKTLTSAQVKQFIQNNNIKTAKFSNI